MKKGQMPLEYIVKLIIVLVALVVIISIMYKYYKEAPTIGPNIEDNKKTQVIENNAFAVSEVAKYVEGCWQLTYNKDEDFICFILKANEKFSFSENDLKKYLSADISSKLNVESINGATLIISYDFANNKIKVYT